MDDKERLSQIHLIARRAFVNARQAMTKQDLHLIMSLCSATDRYLELNAKMFEVSLPITKQVVPLADASPIIVGGHLLEPGETIAEVLERMERKA
jgi:hypothetical protein